MSSSCQVESPITTYPRGTGEWDEHPGVEKRVIGAHSWFENPFGPMWLHWLGQAVFVCMPVTECVGIFLSPLHQVCSVSCYFYDSLRAERETDWGIRILEASLSTSGCDWQEKKGSLCSGNWQPKPGPAQYSPAQYSRKPANMGKIPNNGTVPLHPSLLILTLGQFSESHSKAPGRAFFIKCSELSLPFHFNIRKEGLPRAR